MVFLSSIWIIIGVIFLILGLGSALRFLAYMVRGVGMPYSLAFWLIVIGAIGIVLGLWLILTFWSVVF